MIARPRLAAACFTVGAVLLILVEAAPARVAAVGLIFCGIALGVAAIATPEFLDGDRGSE